MNNLLQKIEDYLTQLLTKSHNNLIAAERAVIFIDEFDKICSKIDDFRRVDVGGLGVQYELLKLLEGANFILQHNGQPIEFRTERLIIICAGAFSYLDKDSTYSNNAQKLKAAGFIDELGDYIPSIYDTETLNFQTLSKDNPEPIQPVNVEYIIDYVGSYYMQLKKGEVFESVGMLEEIYKNNVPSGKYRVSLNHWDGHIEKGMYLKTIANNYNDYIKEIDGQSKDLKDFINMGTLNLLNKGR